MEKQSKVTLIKNLEVTDLDGDKVMVDFETGKYFLLKGTAGDIWECIQAPITVAEIADALMKEYEVSEDDCIQGITEFLENLKVNGFIEIES